MNNFAHRRTSNSRKHTALALGLLLIGLSESAIANKPPNIEDYEMKLIPSYCPDTMGFKYGDAYSNTSPRAGYWVGLMGVNFWHMHHYCWARINLNRSQKAGIPAQTRTALRESVRNDYMYVINNTPRDFIMLPEIYTRLGEIEILLGQPKKANDAFARAREQKPDYWPAYSRWADYLLGIGQRPEALRTVISGLEFSPDSKVLLELFKVLGGKPSDMPKVIVKPPSSTLQEKAAEQDATDKPIPDQKSEKE